MNSKHSMQQRPSAARTQQRSFPCDRSSSRYRTSRDARYRSGSQKHYSVCRVAVVVILALVVSGFGVAFAYYGIVSENLHAGINGDLRAALVDTDLAHEPFYVLLMGTDGSDDRASSQEYAGDHFRSDSIMLARIDPLEKKVTLVSVHRDTLVDMGEYGQNKLNAAHALGGPALAVETVSALAGVPISHYAEINFDGFKDMVNALDGIEVDVPMEIDDEDAGGHVDAGLQTLNGDQALILCRSRHAYDTFGDGDSYRAANQRLVLSAIAKKILATDITTMAGIIQTFSRYVTTDLEIADIIGIAQVMQGLNPVTDIYSGMEPTTSSYIDGVWYEINNIDEWKIMMSRVDKGLPPTDTDIVDEKSGTILASTGSGYLSNENGSLSGGGGSKKRFGTVAIRNGNGITGAGAAAGQRIESLGYTLDSGNADNFDYEQTTSVCS